MDGLETVDVDRVLFGQSDWVGTDLAEKLSQYPLESVQTEFPHYQHSIESADTVPRPRERHPVFFGCYDWHSAVHSHWCLVRQLRLFDGHPRESDIVESIDGRFTSENVEREVEYFDENESFEKPYGWAWLLHLASELSLWDDGRGAEWREVLEPLERRIVNLVETEFLPQERAFRVGTHGNTAFALHCMLDYARTTSNRSLESSVVETSRRLFEDDVDYPVEYEPLGWDTVSPALTEADLMRRVLDHDEFVTWIDAFLPDVTERPYGTLLDPIRVEVDAGGVALHSVGLNLSKAWAMAGLAAALDGHRYAELFEDGAKAHAEYGVERAFTDDYAGAHWLSSFVLYLLTRNDGGIAPES
jgi:hypothetical protein